MTSKRKSKFKTLRIALIGLTGLVVCGVISAFVHYQITKNASSLDEIMSTNTGSLLSTVENGCLDWWGGSENREAIEQGAGLKLPDSAANINASSIAFMDCTVNLSFSMDASELDVFLDSTFVEELVPRKGSDLLRTFVPNYNVGWVFDEDATYLFGQGNDGTSEYQNIVVDNRNPNTFWVYVITMLL